MNFARCSKAWLALSALTLLLPACSSAEASSAPQSQTPACVVGETKCEGEGTSTCEVDASGVASWSAAATCSNDGVCVSGACKEPSPTQRAQAKEFESMVSYLKDNTAWTQPIDWSAMIANGKAEILHGDGSELTYLTALYRAFIAVPEGHQGFYLKSGCGVTIPLNGYSWRGACGVRTAKGILVTSVREGNGLGLNKGDVVTELGGSRGEALFEALAARPSCATSRPSHAFRDADVAATFADLAKVGEQMTVESPDGKTKTISVSDTSAAKPLPCTDPLGRPQNVAAESYLRDDGVGVIRVPGFTDPTVPFPTDQSVEAFEAYRTAFEAKIKAAFAKVKSAPAIVWDVRGNPGGLTVVGLAIASGFPGARTEPISYCTARIAKSDPPRFGSSKYAEYALSATSDYAFAGKVAVLVDGMNYSAADYFALASKTRTNAILVGSPTAGGFGATSDSKLFAGPPVFQVSVDVNLCVRASDATPLEGSSVAPHIVAEYNSADLLRGVDTVLERAVVELKK